MRLVSIGDDSSVQEHEVRQRWDAVVWPVGKNARRSALRGHCRIRGGHGEWRDGRHVGGAG